MKPVSPWLSTRALAIGGIVAALYTALTLILRPSALPRFNSAFQRH